MQQSIEDVIRVLDEFIRGFNTDIILDPTSEEARHNGALLSEYVAKKFGWMTISALQAADKELGDQLYRTPKPKLKSADELAAEENAKMHRDFMKSIAPQPSFEEKVQADKKKRLAAEAAKAQTDAKGQIELAISGYQCYRTNGAGIDYTATELMQKELRTVKFGNDFVRTLTVVRRIIELLPDHPRMGDVARVVEKLNAQLR